MKKPRVLRSNGPESLELPRKGIHDQLEREIGPPVQSGQKQQIINRVQRIIAQEHFSGPLPHPRHLEHNETILPGASERILTMAEKEQIHSAAMDKKIVDAQIEDQKRGMNYGPFSLMVIVGIAAIFGYLGQNITAGLFLSTAVLGSIPVFVNGRSNTRD